MKFREFMSEQQLVTIEIENTGDYDELCDTASGFDIDVKKMGLVANQPHVKLTGSKDSLRELLKQDWQLSDDDIDEMYPELK